MASIFGLLRRPVTPAAAADDGEYGVGGKVRRPRRRAVSASPYARPPPPAPPLPQAATDGSPRRWLSRITSGAGKVFSAVFGSDDEEEEDEEEEEEEEEFREEETDGADGTPMQSMDSYQEERSSAVVPSIIGLDPFVSARKLYIEQLLMQETFSRDEGDKFIEIIQSRIVEPHNVLDGPSMSKTGSIYGELSFPRSSLPGINCYSSPGLATLAVTEAKKWLEEKKSGSKSKSKECTPCSNREDALTTEIEPESHSPVDLAKSYMRSLPPWRTPLRCDTLFKTPLLGGTSLYKRKAMFENSDYSLPAMKVVNHDNPSRGLFESQSEIPTAMPQPSCRFPSTFSRPYFNTDLYDSEILKFPSTANKSAHECTEISEDIDTLPASPKVNAAQQVADFEGTSGACQPCDRRTLSGHDVSVQCEVNDANQAENCGSYSNLPEPNESAGDELHNHDASLLDFPNTVTSAADDAPLNDADNIQTDGSQPDTIYSSNVHLDPDSNIQKHSERSVLNGSVEKTSANSVLEQTNVDSGFASSDGDPSVTISSGTNPTLQNGNMGSSFDGKPMESAKGKDSNSVEQDPPVGRVYLKARRGRKKTSRGARGRGR